MKRSYLIRVTAKLAVQKRMVWNKRLITGDKMGHLLIFTEGIARRTKRKDRKPLENLRNYEE